jgi:hypothetical protein
MCRRKKQQGDVVSVCAVTFPFLCVTGRHITQSLAVVAFVFQPGSVIPELLPTAHMIGPGTMNANLIPFPQHMCTPKIIIPTTLDDLLIKAAGCENVKLELRKERLQTLNRHSHVRCVMQEIHRLRSGDPIPDLGPMCQVSGMRRNLLY